MKSEQITLRERYKILSTEHKQLVISIKNIENEISNLFSQGLSIPCVAEMDIQAHKDDMKIILIPPYRVAGMEPAYMVKLHIQKDNEPFSGDPYYFSRYPTVEQYSAAQAVIMETILSQEI